MFEKLKEVELKQKSNEWLNLKDTKIGSSEIYGLVKNYIKPEELESVGINSYEFTEKPYTTAWELYHKFVNRDLWIRKPLTWVLSEFGNSMEKFAIRWIRKKENFKYGDAVFKEGAVYASENDIRIASLDIEATVNSTDIIQDANGNNIALGQDRDFLVEVKGMSKFKAKKDKILTDGVDWKYILQLQYQLWCKDVNWGIISVFELMSDTLDKRGYIIRCAETMNKKDYKYIDEATKKKMFFYKRLPQYAKIFELALKRFQDDVKFKNEPKMPKTKDKKFFFQLMKRQSEIMNWIGFDFEKNKISFNKNSKSINISEGEFDIEKLFEDDMIKVAGTKNNDGIYKIISITKNEIKVDLELSDELNVSDIKIYRKIDSVIKKDFSEYFKQYELQKKEIKKFDEIKAEIQEELYKKGKLEAKGKHGKIAYTKSGQFRITIKKES